MLVGFGQLSGSISVGVCGVACVQVALQSHWFNCLIHPLQNRMKSRLEF